MKDVHFFSGRMGNEMFRDAYLYSQFRDGVIPDVYVQSEEYFKKYSAEIKQRYSEGIGFLPYVGVHVRRAGNPLNPAEPKYSENPFYVDLGKTDYYERAMAMFPGKKFLVFSDDPAWCKERFKGDNIQVMEGGTELEDFNQLASCSDVIMANSSFSWWAAYLCSNPSKKIVYPKDWYADGVKRTTCPPEWIPI